MLTFTVLSVLLLSVSEVGAGVIRSGAFNAALSVRQASNSSASGLEVDLGYEIYQGYNNATVGLNIWKGIRFAASPTGSNRWQAPQPPAFNRSAGPISANSYAPTCSQNGAAVGATTGENQTLASEDCLFLNVYAPSNHSGLLPVLVWIHGGGYGGGNGREDLSAIIHANNNSFVGVSIQYRLGAFGFLSSDEVFRSGVVNAGLLDQHFALQWVQAYVGLFGGNSSHVTISGESAGGGSVMLQDMAFGGSQGPALFINTIAASPYLPMQYGYKDFVPSQSYYAFASLVGCPAKTAYGSGPQTIFECLVSKDFATLENASATISASGTYGTWGFLPVTDGIFVQQTPSQQLLQKRVNGVNALVGNNADEGEPFVPQNITTEQDLVAWIQLSFPLMTNDDIAKILLYYPSTNASDSANNRPFATSGDSGPTANNQSDAGVGQQQRANNIYAETTFVCPAYWLAEAYSDHGRSSYKYQYSIPVATHGSDVTGYFGPAATNQGPAFELAFQSIWGNFITGSNPSISNAIANGANSTNPNAPNAASSWPPFTIYAPYQMDLNQTGGTAFNHPVNAHLNYTEYGPPGTVNNITMVNAYTWEGGRGYRCDFWRAIAAIVPE